MSREEKQRKAQEAYAALQRVAHERYGTSIKGAKLIERGLPKRGISKYAGAYKEIIAKGFLPGRMGKKAPKHMMPRTLGAATGTGVGGKPCMGALMLSAIALCGMIVHVIL